MNKSTNYTPEEMEALEKICAFNKIIMDAIGAIGAEKTGLALLSAFFEADKP